MGRILIIFGLAVTAISPLAYGILVALPRMPGCQAGSAPAAGCLLLGFDISWLVQLLMIASLGFFFLIPLGIVLFLLGIVVALLNRDKNDENA